MNPTHPRDSNAALTPTLQAASRTPTRLILNHVHRELAVSSCALTALVPWSSKMQTTVALSATEAECVALSTALRDVIFLMESVKEFETHGAPIPKSATPTIECRVFEDNVGALELATTHKLRPCTKHIAAQCHHFRHCVQTNQIQIKHISTTNQITDTFTKPLPRATFEHLRDLFAQVARVCEGVWTKPQRHPDGSVRVRRTSLSDQCTNANVHTHASRTKENQMNSIAPSNWLGTMAHNPDFRFGSTKTMAPFFPLLP